MSASAIEKKIGMTKGKITNIQQGGYSAAKLDYDNLLQLGTCGNKKKNVPLRHGFSGGHLP